MSLYKYIDRLQKMDDLIRRRATGTPAEFAEKLNISRSQLLQDIKELRELGTSIEYSHIFKSYHYTGVKGIILSISEMNKYRGGFCSLYF